MRICAPLKAPAARRAPRVPVAASSERGSASRSASAPKWRNMNSRGCQPTVTGSLTSRPRRGRTIHRATVCSTLAGSGKISWTCSVGWHPRLFTLHPFGIHFGLRRQSAAATALSHARRPHEFAETFARPKSGVALRLPPQSKTRPARTTIHPFNTLTI
jgi:hypothetical protein